MKPPPNIHPSSCSISISREDRELQNLPSRLCQAIVDKRRIRRELIPLCRKGGKQLILTALRSCSFREIWYLMLVHELNVPLCTMPWRKLFQVIKPCPFHLSTTTAIIQPSPKGLDTQPKSDSSPQYGRNQGLVESSLGFMNLVVFLWRPDILSFFIPVGSRLFLKVQPPSHLVDLLKI